MGRARIIDGKRAAGELRAAVARETAALGLRPGLAVVLVGDDPASQVYVRNKTRALAEAGMAGVERRLPADTSEAALLDLVAALNGDPGVDGILVQLPLPAGIDPARVAAAIDPAKDVDGFHPVNAGRLAAGLPGGLVPCTPQGAMLLLARAGAELEGAEALVVGRSPVVGRPMALLLLAADATVSVAHSRTRGLAEACRRADVLVAAIGRAGTVRGDWIKPGAAVIDVGINRVPAPGGGRRLAGDVAFDEAVETAGAITPVPGGVGPMTVACLVANTLRAACARRGLACPLDPAPTPAPVR